jgi:hypothetical protein
MMRLRRSRVRPLKQVGNDSKKNAPSAKGDLQDSEAAKVAKPVSTGKSGLFRTIISNPNFAFQIMTIVLTLASDNVSMDRRIDTMTSKIDAIRGIADVINNTMQSVKVASEAPKHIRKLLQ